MFVRQMVNRFPQLEEILKEHARDNFGETLPHVFLGEFTRYLLSLLRTAEHNDDEAMYRNIQEILNYLEDSFSTKSESVQELIAVSSLENLPQRGEQESQILDMIGPNLRAQLGELR
jgi:hypothetical protein